MQDLILELLQQMVLTIPLQMLVEGITAGTPIYGASYGSARYITNGVGFGAAFDWGVFPNNNGGARLRLNKPDGGIANGTNVHSGVTVGYNLFMFPSRRVYRE